MIIQKFSPTKPQHELFQTFGNQSILEILYGGAAGGGKSYAVWALAIMMANKYPDIRIGLARNTLVTIKKNSMSTFYEVVRNLGIPEDYYTYNEQKGEITFVNKSQIIFFELQYLPSDPNYDRFGGSLLTFGIIEEAAGCDNRGKQVFSSRLGRWMNDVYDIPAHLYMTTNPGRNFVFTDFYNPWTRGELAAHRRFIPAKLHDNTYQPKNYAESLKTRLDGANAKRLLDGDWNSDDDETRLCTYENVTNVFNVNPKFEPTGEYYITADIAMTSDKCMILLWKGLTIIKTIHYTGQEAEKEIESLTAQYKVNPKNVVYDADGVGKYLIAKLREAKDFINNSRALYQENYENLKTQCYFKLAELINEGKIKCLDNKFYDEAVQELYEIKSRPLAEVNGKLQMVSKKDVKAVIGRSPDISDAMAFRMWFEIKRKVVCPF